MTGLVDLALIVTRFNETLQDWIWSISKGDLLATERLRTCKVGTHGKERN